MRQSFIIPAVIWALFVTIYWTVTKDTSLLEAGDNTWYAWLQYVVSPWAVTFMVLFCGYIIGDLSLSRFVPSSGIRDVFIAGVGLGILAVLTFLLGLIHLLYIPAFIIIGVGILAFGYRRLWDLLGRTWKRFRSIRSWQPEEILMMVMILWYVYRTMALATNPSVGWDTGNSHLAAPKWYLKEHAIHFQPWINFNNFPQLVEMLGMYVMALIPRMPGTWVGDPGGTVTYMYLLGICLVIYGLMQDRKLGLLAILIWLSMPFATRYSQELLVEPALSFYCALGVYALVVWKRADLAGLALGCALSTKYTAAPFLLILAVAAGRKDWWKVLVWAIPIAAAWYIRNIVLFGNPVFPFMDRIARVPGIGTVPDVIRTGLVIDQNAMLATFKISWREVGSVLWWGTMKEREPWLLYQQPSSIGPWLLAFLPVMLIGLRQRASWIVAGTAGAYAIYWVGIERIWDTRYLIIAWPLFCVAAAWGIKEVRGWFK